MAIIWVYIIHYVTMYNYKFFKCLVDVFSFNPARNGDMGVDIFFVLSGYLITDILIREIEKYGRIDKFHFYRSRFFRIWPALAISVILEYPSGNPLNLSYTDGLLCLMFVSNIFGVLSHLWSVAVEF